MSPVHLTLPELAAQIATRVRLAAAAVAIGELGMAERLIDVCYVSGALSPGSR